MAADEVTSSSTTMAHFDSRCGCHGETTASRCGYHGEIAADYEDVVAMRDREGESWITQLVPINFDLNCLILLSREGSGPCLASGTHS